VSKRAKKGSLKEVACIVDGCDEKAHAKMMCKRHYGQAWRTGKVRLGLKGQHGPVEERFWHFVEKLGPDDCWNWKGNCDKDGYGSIRTPTTQLRAHRVSYQINNPDKSIDGLVVRHTCHNPSCVNPTHLLRGTNQDNVDDKMRAGRCPISESHGNTKFSNEIVEQVRASSGTNVAIAKKFGISRSQVRNIRTFSQRPPVKDHEQK